MCGYYKEKIIICKVLSNYTYLLNKNSFKVTLFMTRLRQYLILQKSYFNSSHWLWLGYWKIYNIFFFIAFHYFPTIFFLKKNKYKILIPFKIYWYTKIHIFVRSLRTKDQSFSTTLIKHVRNFLSSRATPKLKTENKWFLYGYNNFTNMIHEFFLENKVEHFIRGYPIEHFYKEYL